LGRELTFAKMADKMAHTDDSIEVCAMSVGSTLKITPTQHEKTLLHTQKEVTAS